MGGKIGPYELNRIYTGDARALAEGIPDNSVDLIFTDPVYSQIEDYEWLAKTAARVLKDDRACLVWIAKGLLPDILDIMKPQLNYVWPLENHRVGASNFGYAGKLITKLEMCLWFGRGHSVPNKVLWDYHQSTDWPRFHALGWDKSQSCLVNWLEAFTQPGAIVFDPFTGGGTVPAVCKMLGRNYLAFEIDPATADKARERVFNTQPPLLLPEPIQAGMF